MKQLTQQHSSRKLNSDYRLFFYLSVCFSQSNILQEKVSRVCEEFLPCEDSFILYSILWRSRVCPASLPRKWSKDWDTGGGPMHLLLSPEIQICIYFNQRGGRKRKLSQTFFFFFWQERPYFHQKHVYFENKAWASHLLFTESFSIPEGILVCKHSEAVFRAFTLPVSLRTDPGGCSVPMLSGHVAVPATAYSIVKKMCHAFEDNRISPRKHIK